MMTLPVAKQLINCQTHALVCKCGERYPALFTFSSHSNASHAEHMLFYASEKYPEEDSFDKYTSQVPMLTIQGFFCFSC